MMSKPKTTDGKRVTISVKVSEPTAAMIDAVRGEMTRSAWLQQSIGVVLGTAPLSAALHNGDRTGFASATADPAPPAALSVAGRRNGKSKPPAVKAAGCFHRLPAGAYCKTCGCAKT